MKKFLRRVLKPSIRISIGLAITAIAVAHVLGFLPSDLIRRIDYIIYDVRLKAQVLEPVLDDRILIVDLDERSLQEIGRWPWSRSKVSELVTKLTDELGAAVVTFDVVFAEPEKSDAFALIDLLDAQNPSLSQALNPVKPLIQQTFDHDKKFAQVLKDRPVVLGYYFNQNPSAISGALPPPLFTVDQLDGISLISTEWQGYGANLYELQRVSDSGFFNPILDPDGTVRSVPLLAQFDGGYYQSLALATLRVYLGNPQVIPVFPLGVADDYGALEYLALRSQEIELDIPVQRGLVELVNYRASGGPNAGGYRYISAADILNNRIRPEEIEGRIVLIGTTAPGLLDLRSTPVNPAFPGVEVHANVLSSMLDGEFKMVPEYSQGVVLIFTLLVGIPLAIIMPLLTATWSMVSALFVFLSSLALNSYMFYEQNLVFPVAIVIVMAIAIFVFDVAYGYLSESRTKRQMVNLFGEYVAPELVSEMAANPTGYSMEGESRFLSVLFSDVRGFTTISESLEPNQLREYINEYLTCMSEIIRGNRGTLDKYIGDAIMAFWGAPIPDDQHATYAITAGLAMLEEVPHLNQRLVQRGWPALAIGIGINTGQMRVGDMGSKIRKAYTVMGDAVNLGSRLEGITKTYGVGLIVGQETQTDAPSFAYRELDRVRVKGKDEPVAIYQPIKPQEQLTDDDKNELRTWQQFLIQFREQNWEQAQHLLDQTRVKTQLPVLYELYSQRINVFKSNPPGEHWDGVTRFETK